MEGELYKRKSRPKSDLIQLEKPFFEILVVVTQMAQWLDKKIGILWQATIWRPEEAKFMGKEGNNDFLALSFSFNE